MHMCYILRGICPIHTHKNLHLAIHNSPLLYWACETDHSLINQFSQQKLLVAPTAPSKISLSVVTKRDREREWKGGGDWDTFSRSNKKQASPNSPFFWRGAKFPCAYGLPPPPPLSLPLGNPASGTLDAHRQIGPLTIMYWKPRSASRMLAPVDPPGHFFWLDGADEAHMPYLSS